MAIVWWAIACFSKVWLWSSFIMETDPSGVEILNHSQTRTVNNVGLSPPLYHLDRWLKSLWLAKSLQQEYNLIRNYYIHVKSLWPWSFPQSKHPIIIHHIYELELGWLYNLINIYICGQDIFQSLIAIKLHRL